MDFRHCPSCKQSVLDDDAAECPFCGASMSAKGSAAKPKPPATDKGKPAAPAKSAAGKPSTEKPAAKRRRTDPDETPEDDDPFSLESMQAANAIAASAKPAKGRLLKVVCPMCETDGFVPKTAAGRDIKCANPDCMVPIFKAPASDKAARAKKKAAAESAEAASEAAAKRSPMALYGGVAGGLAVLGLVAFFMFSGGPNEEDLAKPAFDPSTFTPSEEDPGGEASVASTAGPNQQPESQTADPNINVAAPDLSKLRDRTLQDMVSSARDNDGNRDKPYCRRLNADAFALCGQIDKAESELQQLLTISADKSYYRIEPLTRIAWHQLAAGQTAAANATIEEALKAAERLPNIGRTPIDAVTSLSAVLIATGRAANAEQLIKTHRRDLNDNRNRLEAELSTVVQVSREFEVANLDSTNSRAAVPRVDPQRAGITLILTAHDRWNEAISWSLAATDSSVQADCLAACAGQLPRASDDVLQAVSAAAGRLKAAPQARVFATIARSLTIAGQQSRAGDAMARADSVLAGLKPPAAFILPDMRGTFNLELRDSTPNLTAAIAAGELAVAQAVLADQDKVTKLLNQALAFTAATAPPLAVARNRQKEVTAMSSSALGAQLKDALALVTNSQVRSAQRSYEKKVETLAEAADERLEFEESLLQSVAARGAAVSVARLMEPAIDSTNATVQSLLLETTLPYTLSVLLKTAGENDLATRFQQAAAEPEPSSAVGLRVALLKLLEQNNFDAMASVINRSKLDVSLRQRTATSLALQLIDEDRFPDATNLIRAFSNQLWRELALDIAISRAVRKGDPTAIRGHIDAARFPPTERVSAYHGLITGIVAKSSTEPEKSAASANATVR